MPKFDPPTQDPPPLVFPDLPPVEPPNWQMPLGAGLMVAAFILYLGSFTPTTPDEKLALDVGTLAILIPGTLLFVWGSWRKGKKKD